MLVYHVFCILALLVTAWSVFAQNGGRFSELTAKGIAYVDQGRFNDALNAPEEVWEQDQSEPIPATRCIQRFATVAVGRQANKAPSAVILPNRRSSLWRAQETTGKTFRERMLIMKTVTPIIVCLTCICSVFAQPYGRFEGLPVEASWDANNTTMTLTRPLVYVDSSGVRWEAPVGTVTDGATIPKFAWQIIGNPLQGAYRNAAVIHDAACDKKEQPWELVDLTFYYALRDSVHEPLARICLTRACAPGGMCSKSLGRPLSLAESML